MPLDLFEQYLLVADNARFRGRVQAALTATAITKAVAAAHPDPDTQAKRLLLATEVLSDPARRVTQFAWIVVTRPTMPDAPEDITDTQITTEIASTFDTAAQVLITLPVP